MMLPSFGQSKSSKPVTPKAVKGYGEASYTLDAAEKYMSTWLIAGPVPVATGEASPPEQTQVSAFTADVSPVTVDPKKPVAPMSVNGKTYGWEVVKTITDKWQRSYACRR